MKMEKIGSDASTVHKISNRFITIEILELDGRVLQISDRKTGYRFLSERIFSLAARSKYPYGITTWVKTGDVRDGAAGVLSENALGYDVRLSAPLMIEKKKNRTVITCFTEKNKLILEKILEIEENAPYFTYTTRLINKGKKRKFQIEHFFVWNSDNHRNQISFVVPYENGLDELRFPSYDELDCHAIVPVENWAAFLDSFQKSAVIFRFCGIHRISRYIAGNNGQCAGYSPEIALEKDAEIVNSHRFYIIPDIRKSSSKSDEIERIRKNLLFLLEKKSAISVRQTIEDRIATLVPLPQKLIRKQGQFKIDSELSIEAQSAEKEVELFIRQMKIEHGLKINKKSGEKKIKIILQPMAHPQAYKMEITQDAIYIAGTNQSVQYGLQTLLDLCTKSGKDLVLPCCEIEDWPEIEMRGMLMFPSGKKWDILLKKFAMGVLTRMRFNTFMIYMAPGSFIPEKPVEGIIPMPDAVEEYRLKNLANELKDMHIKILVCCSTKHIVCPSCQKKETEVMCEFISRIIDIFRPDFINIGYDEMGRFNPSCKCNPDAKNHQAFVRSVSFFHGFIRENGSRASIWCDMLFRKEGDTLGWLDDPQWALDALPRDIILNDYEYMPDVEEYPRIEKWKKAGFDVICTPWAIEENILHWAISARKYGADGILGSSWAEGPSKNNLGYIEGLVWTGIIGWRSTGLDISGIKNRIKIISERISERKWEKI